ncbi:FAD-dependent oxidoreductase [Candidatus Amarobacter glycogenicus]|uniref:phytoene desaturase family protein n=1 Tax=Candidatus Amarobacter glycogenicus TaxID=3140699 RepID=UPI0031CCCD80
MTNDSPRHIAIAGGGLAGLATAALLARSGNRVTLFERSHELGGRAATSEHHGYFHNRGPHALYLGGAAAQVLAELDVSYTGRSPDLSGVAVRNGRAYTLPTSAKSMLTTRLFGVRARLEAGRQLLALRRVDPSDHRTVRQWLDAGFAEPAARDYVAALIRLSTYADAPDVTLVGDAARQLNGSSGPVLYVDGGWQSLVDGIEACALAAGAEVLRGCRVEGVTYAAERATGLRLAGGETVAADAVVLAVPPEAARDLAGQHRSLAALAEQAVPARAACLDIGLTRLPNPRRKFGLGIDTPFYFSVHSLWAKLAPEGRVLASVAKYLPAGASPDPSRDLAELEAFLDLVQPGWRKFEEHRQFLPNMVVHSALPLAANGGIAGRPAPAVPGAAGLFVAGDWVGQDGWLADAVLGSARRAAGAISASFTGTPVRAVAAVS